MCRAFPARLPLADGLPPEGAARPFYLHRAHLQLHGAAQLVQVN